MRWKSIWRGARHRASQTRRRQIRVESLESRSLLAIFTVNSVATTRDSYADDELCDTANNPLEDPPVPPSGVCTLAAALDQADATDGDDEIRFAIPGSGVPVIEAFGFYVGGVGNGSVEIDGTTQAAGKVELHHNLLLGGEGGHTVKGLVFSRGRLELFSSGNTVVGNYFGTTADGLALGDGASSINVQGDNNRVGGVIPSERNVIAGTLRIGGSNNHVFGNYIGTDATGEIALRAENVGIVLTKGLDNEIGGDVVAKGNVVVGQSMFGAIRIEAENDDYPRQTIVRNNFLGTNKDGTRALGNIGGGLRLRNTSDNAIFDNVIAASRPAEGQPHVADGILLFGDVQRTQIQGNRIGVNAAGTVTDPDGVPLSGDEFGHYGSGIVITGDGANAPTGNVVGGASAHQANVIGGSEFGVELGNRAEGNTVQGNFIGTNAAGTVAFPNGVGVNIEHASKNLIGGVAGNVISGNRAEGVRIVGVLATDNMVANNRIGVNSAGTSAVANAIGVFIFAAGRNCVGGVVPVNFAAPSICAASPTDESTLLGNVISGNSRYGVQVAYEGADGNFIQANRIGTNAAGTAAIGNGWDGVALDAGADDNVIGGTAMGRGNLISGNAGDGVLVIGAADDPNSNNVIAGNFIGTDATGLLEVANGARGIHLDGNVFQTTIGGDTAASRNVISGNRLDGIIVALGTTTANVIKNNYIGTDQEGRSAIPNQRNGILLLNSPGNFIGEVVDSSSLGNVISGNALSGVRIQGAEASGNVLVANTIGLNVARDERLENGLHGVWIFGAPDNLLGGEFLDAPSSPTYLGNVISGNKSSGVRIEGLAAANNRLGANLIGADGAGVRPLFNGGNGVHVLNAPRTRIGQAHVGESPLSGNTISGNLNGVVIEGTDAQETLIGANRIGVDWRGAPSEPASLLGNTVDGVRVIDASETYVGGLYFSDGDAVQVAGNVIASNTVGVRILGDAARGNRIQRNEIFGNLSLGIDLGGDGISPNDDDTVLAGPNATQNYPVELHFREFDRSVTGRLVSRPNASFTIDVYANPGEDPSGAGEGRTWVTDFVVSTDAQGESEFTIPILFDAAQPWIALTATSDEGHTSEFSGPLRQADLDVLSISLFPAQVRKTAQGYELPLQVTVRNLGTAPATDALIRVTGNGQPLDASATITLQPGEVQILTGTWALNSLLQAEPRGVALLDLIVQADPNNVIDELPTGVNFRAASMTADARPVITELKKEFAEGVFLQGVPLDNRLEAYVDWNGNLDGVEFTTADLPEFNFQINGIAGLPDGGVVSVDAATPTTFTIGMHDDLRLGPNVILLEARNRLQNFYSDPTRIRYDQLATVPYIETPLWTVEGSGGTHEQTAEYAATIFLPELATGGLFNVPVDRVGVTGGAFGPELPQAEVTATLRSNRTSSIDAEFHLGGEVADEDLGGAESSVSATLHGEFAFEPELRLAEFSGTLRGDVGVKGPKVPLPPVPWIRAQASIGLGVDATLAWKENAVGDLELDPDVVLGLEPSGEFAFSVSLRGVGVEVAGGANLRGEFSLAQNPCLFLGGNAELFVRLTATAWIFEASKTIPVVSVPLPACGETTPATDGEYAPPAIATTLNVLPRYVLPASDAAGESSDSTLPVVPYPYAKPALARHSDGSMTLTYVSEDATQAVGQQLEIFASHFDGAAWSPPEQITHDVWLDDAPSVAYDAIGQAVAVWSRVKRTIDDPSAVDPQTLLGDLEVVWSRRDVATGQWSVPTALTNDSQMDHLPQVAQGADGQVLVVWTRALGNDWPLFPDDDSRSLTADFYYSVWNGSGFSEPAVAVAGASSAATPALAIGAGEGLLVWSEDSDRDVTTDGDTSIRATRWDGSTWTAPIVVGGAADGFADLAPQVSFAPSGAATIGWVRAGAPVPGDEDDFVDELVAVDYSSLDFSAPMTLGAVDDVTELRLIHDAVGNSLFVWAGRSDVGPDIFAARRDAATLVLGEPLPLTQSPDLEWSLRPLINASGALEVIYLERQLGSETVVIGGSGTGAEGDGEPGSEFEVPTFLGSSLASIESASGADLVVNAIELANPNPTPGSVVDVRIGVRNTGLAATSSFAVELLDSGIPIETPLIVSSLAGGATTFLTFKWTVPIGAVAPRQLLARVDTANAVVETSEGNNTLVATVLRPDLRVENASASRLDGELQVGARLFNRGGSTITTPMVVEFRLDDAASGPLIGTTDIASSLAPGAWIDIAFSIDDPLATLERVRTGHFQADPTDAIDEFSETNNSASVVLSPFSNWRNPRDPLDVNFDTFVSPLDALLVINDLNAIGSRLLAVPAYPPAFLDVSGDLFVSAIDALLVINRLNDLSGPEGESETAAARPNDMSAGATALDPRRESMVVDRVIEVFATDEVVREAVASIPRESHVVASSSRRDSWSARQPNSDEGTRDVLDEELLTLLGLDRRRRRLQPAERRSS